MRGQHVGEVGGAARGEPPRRRACARSGRRDRAPSIVGLEQRLARAPARRSARAASPSIDDSRRRPRASKRRGCSAPAMRTTRSSARRTGPFELAVDRAAPGRPRMADEARRSTARSREQLRRRRRAVEAVGIFLGDEAGGELARAEARVLHQRREEIDIVADALDLEASRARRSGGRSPRRGWAPR